MFNSKMYKLEKLVFSYKANGFINNSKKALTEYILAKNKISSEEEINYIKSAIAIPYNEMLEHIAFYHSQMMDEGDELFWIDRLSKQYDLPGNLIVKRFHNVSKLSSSLIYKKRMLELYSINEKEKTLIKK